MSHLATKHGLMSVSPRQSLALLIVVTVGAWGIPVFEVFYYGAMSVVSIVTAGMLTTMLIVWPFLTGRRLHDGKLESAMMCVECHSMAWPTEEALGFCLRCGSTRKAVPALRA